MNSFIIHKLEYYLRLLFESSRSAFDENWQGIPTTRLNLGGEVMVPRDNRTVVSSTELLNYIILFATQGKIGHYNI